MTAVSRTAAPKQIQASRQAPEVAKYVSAHKAISKSAASLGAAGVTAKLTSLGYIPDALWKDGKALDDVSKSLASIAKKFPKEFREGYLQFELNKTMVTKDTAYQQKIAKDLIKEFPNSPLVAWAKSLLPAETGWAPK